MKFFICLSVLVSIVYGRVLVQFPDDYESIVVKPEDGPFVKELKNEIIEHTGYVQNYTKNLLETVLDSYANQIMNITTVSVPTAFKLTNCAKKLNDKLDVSVPVKAFSNCALDILETNEKQLTAMVNTIVPEIQKIADIYRGQIQQCNSQFKDQNDINKCISIGTFFGAFKYIPSTFSDILITIVKTIRLFNDARSSFEDCIQEKRLGIIHYFSTRLETAGECVVESLTTKSL